MPDDFDRGLPSTREAIWQDPRLGMRALPQFKAPELLSI